MEASAVLLEKPPISSGEQAGDVYSELGDLAWTISEEFGRPSPVDEDVVQVETHILQPVATITEQVRRVRASGHPDFKASALHYYNLRLSPEDNGWKFDFMIGANPDEKTPSHSGGTLGSQRGNEENRPWMDEDSIRELEVHEAEVLLWGMQSLYQDLIEQNLAINFLTVRTRRPGDVHDVFSDTIPD